MLNIAVLEDNHALRALLCELLSAEGYRAWGAFDALELDERLVDRPIDLLLLDLGLPGEDGFSVATRLRAVMPSLYIIMTTARGTLKDRVSGYACGADLYLPKPVATDELLAAVASVARRVGAHHELVQMRLPLLDSLDQTLSGHGLVRLSRTETRILKMLATAQGQLAPTHMLLELSGKHADEKSKASLEVQMTHLRKKLEQACPGELRIRAVRGEGYQLVGRVQLSQ
jgi:DNA-binding response OmpR family regulator